MTILNFLREISNKKQRKINNFHPLRGFREQKIAAFVV